MTSSFDMDALVNNSSPLPFTPSDNISNNFPGYPSLDDTFLGNSAAFSHDVLGFDMGSADWASNPLASSLTAPMTAPGGHALSVNPTDNGSDMNQGIYPINQVIGMSPSNLHGDTPVNSFAPTFSNGKGAIANDLESPAAPSMAPSSMSLSTKTALYRASIAAHHSTLLCTGNVRLPSTVSFTQPSSGLGRPGQPLTGGGRSAPTVPRSQMTATNNGLKALTLQERRRLSRQLQRQHVKNARNAKQASSENPKTSGRGQKRTMHFESNGEAITIKKEASHGQTFPAAQPLATPVKLVNNDLIYRGTFPQSGKPLLHGNGTSYSSSGFDLFDILNRVMKRPNPHITIGPVDFSCSFTVSSARDPDNAIIYASDTFCRLTGYHQHEILGRNCRFLQSPTGEVEKGATRTFTDSGAVSHIEKHLTARSECQASLINYRKDGQPFINLVTIIPIAARNSTEIEFFVGFQVDLIEQPKAIVQRSEDGVCVVNYASPPEDEACRQNHAAELEVGKETMMAHELSETIGRGTNDARQWARLLLDNSHDVIHVLSLKGVFLYVSPSVERLTGFRPEDMIGRSISEFCHPNDVVPVFRELKDSTNNASITVATRRASKHDPGSHGPSVNLMMRLRCKDHGYVWIESSGKLHLEQGKGRKVIVSSARPRPAHDLSWVSVQRYSSLEQPSFWSKMSVNGLILSTTSPVIDVLGKTAHSMSGHHLVDFIEPTNLSQLLSALQKETASSVPHTMIGSSGQKVPVISTFFPASDTSSLHSRTLFVHSRLMDKADDSQNDLNMAAEIYSRPGTASAFEELSTSRTSSWIFELHQLKNANRRLREEVRTINNRARGTLKEMEPTQPSPSLGARARYHKGLLATGHSGNSSAEDSSRAGSSTDVFEKSEGSSGEDTGVTSAGGSGSELPTKENTTPLSGGECQLLKA